MVLLLRARPVELSGKRAVRKHALARARLRQHMGPIRPAAVARLPAGLVVFRSPPPTLSPSAPRRACGGPRRGRPPAQRGATREINNPPRGPGFPTPPQAFP